MKFGQDDNGAYKILDDGRVLRATERVYNTLLTISPSLESLTWEHGW